VLATYQGAVSESQYRYLESLAGIADGNQSASDKQEGYDKAETDLRTLYNAGASSADLQSAYDALAAAGKIEPGREQFWKSMISLRQNEEKEIEQGKISTDQKEYADWGMVLLGEAMSVQERTNVLIEMVSWLKAGTITQTQYDMAVAYCRVLDGNEQYIQDLEAKESEHTEHAILVDDILGYIIDVAGNHSEASEYYNKFVEDGEVFSEAEKRSIEIALEMREKMDAGDALYEMSEKQSAAYDQCVAMLGLCKTTAKQLETLETFKEKLAPEVYEELKMVLEFQAEDPDNKRETDAINKGYGSAAEYDAAVLEGKEIIEYNHHQYKLTGEEFDLSDDKSYAIVRQALVKALNLSNPYDKSIPNGTTLWLEKRNFLGGYDIVEKTVTYYNGKWYLSKQHD
jgi:hypothetical protein